MIAFFQQLKTQRDKMKQFIKRKERCLEKERELARELIREGKKEYVFSSNVLCDGFII